MLNSLLMLGSTTKKSRVLNYICSLIWVCYMLSNANLKSGIVFAAVNTVVFFIVFLLGQFVRGKYTNAAISIFSILIWSVLIDIVCYFMYPSFTMGLGILNYIWNGILFNYKYVFINVIALVTVNGIEYGIKKLKDLYTSKKEVISSI